jgi:hypothetical protein
MNRWLLLALLIPIAAACGGASKPPLQPDNDPTSSLGDGGPDPTAPLPSVAPASSK